MVAAAPAPSLAGTVWKIDPSHSLVEFGVKHMMFTTVKGRFGGVSGEVVTPNGDPTHGTVAVEIEAATIDTRDERRDAHLRSGDFFDVETYPTLRFVSSGVEPQGGQRFRLIGDLMIRDVTKSVVLDATFNGSGVNLYGQQVAGYTAETTINRKEFGLTWNAALEAGGVAVSEEVKLTLEIQAAKQG